ncbi:MAG: YceI family protein [Flavitalea sp.]
MKKQNLIYLAAFAMLGFTACTDAPESDEAKTSEAKEVTTAEGAAYKVDPAGSKIEWIGTKVTGFHHGELSVKSGELDVKDTAITGGSFIIDMTSLKVVDKGDTATNNKLQGHLVSPDFFDVAKNPEAKFEITSVKPFTGSVTDSADVRQEGISQYKVANPTHLISGNLTLKGVTKNVEFPAKVTISGTGVDAIAKFNIDRKQWNIVYPGKPNDLIRDNVHLGIALKATK